MSFLNNNNFCKWIDPANTSEFTIDGDFDNGISSIELPDWNLTDTAPIGDNNHNWVWISTTDNNVISSGANDWSKGLSQELEIKKNHVYHFNLRCFITNGKGDQIVRFLFVTGENYQVAKEVTLNDNTFYNPDFFAIAEDDYQKVMIVVENDTGSGSGGVDFVLYRMQVTEFDQCFYSLPLIRFDELSVFVNGELDDTDVPFSTLKVGLFSNGEILIPDLATLNQIVISGDIYSAYFTWTVSGLWQANFRFVLYDDSSGIQKMYYLSNSFTKSTSKKFTALVKYRNSADTLGYQYASVPSFYNKFRIDLWAGRSNFPENITGYETYDGGFIKTKSDITKLREFETRFFDEGAHEAFASMLAHSEVLIDDVEHKKTNDGDYSIAWSDDDDNKIGNGSVNLLIVDYSSAIKIC